MPRRKWTPEQKKAWGEKMKAAREAKAMERAQANEMAGKPQVEQLKPSESAEPPEVNPGEDTVTQLLKRIEELEKQRFFQQPLPPQPQGAQVTSGGIIGTTVKYSVNPKDYPDPRDRLFEERRLKLKGFTRDWWDLEWEISRVNYETKDHLNMAEPKFQIRLIRIIEDPETGEPSAKRYTLWKGTFFEDPQAAIAVASQHGIEVPGELVKTFLDEMRYLRIRDWLLEAFYPHKPAQGKMNKKETVIGNRLVEVYEINSEKSETVPFEQLNKKL